jgi:hypothetical protein
MSKAPSAASIAHALAKNLLPELPAAIRQAVAAAAPARVVTPDLQPSQWRVPVRLGDRTVGFMDFDLEGDLVRYGNRLQGSAKPASLPPDVMDMDADARETKAREVLQPGDTLENSATLIADQSPTRIAWMMQAHGADGAPFRVFVTPQFAWVEREGSAGTDKAG